MSGLVDKIKGDVKRAGTNKSKFIYFREGVKQRVRFLVDMDDGLEVTFHDSYERNINVPCQEIFGRDCPYCEEEGLRTRSLYAWPVYNYENKEVQIFMFPVNNCSPVPALMAMYENYGTITDRDYVISVSGRQQNKTYSVVPMDKVRFRNEKAKPLSEKAMLKMIDKAYPCDDVGNEDEDEDEDDRPRNSKKDNKPSKSKRRQEPEDDDDYDGDDYDDDDGDVDYDDMTPVELFKLCKERGISVPPKKSAKFYIKQLEEYDRAQDDWGDDGNDDDWEDDE